MNNGEVAHFVKIGHRVKQMRIEKGISQKSLANALDIPVSTLANYEAERREFPIDLLKKIPDVLGCKMRDILPEMMYHSRADGGFYFFWGFDNKDDGLFDYLDKVQEVSRNILNTNEKNETITNKENWTEEELAEIEQFKKFLLSKRQNKD